MNGFKKCREAMSPKLTQASAAKAFGVEQTAVSNWEVGASFPRAEMLPKIAALYQCTVDELLTPEPKNKPA